MDRLKQIELLLLQDPEDEFLLYGYALELYGSGNKESAIDKMLDLYTNKKQYLPIYYQLGKWMEKENRLEEAVRFYKEGIALATTLNNKKTLSELKQALYLISEDDDDF